MDALLNHVNLSMTELYILYVLSDDTHLSNSKISRVIRKPTSTISEKLSTLKEKGLVKQDDNELEYFITNKGKKLLQTPKYESLYYTELQEYVKQLKEQPEKKGWNPNQSNIDRSLTYSESHLLYLFKKDEYFSNAKIARILKKDPATTHKDLKSLVQRNLIGKNEDSEYYITSTGFDLVEKNVSNSIQCEKIQSFVHRLKSRHMLYGATALFTTLFSISKPSEASAVPASLETTSQVSSGTIPISTASNISAKTKTGVISNMSTSTKILISVLAILAIGGGIFGSVYANSSNALLEMENLITLANAQYENKQYEASFDTFSKVDRVFLSTAFSPDHLEHAEYLHLQSLTGMGNSLQSQSNFGQIKSLSEKSEEYYLYALVLYEGKHDTQNAWIGRGINAIYQTPEKTLEICSMFKSVNSHMCQGEAYSYMYVIGKAPLEKAEEQFALALNMAGSEKQKLKVQDDIDTIMSKVQKDIDTIYDYYKLPSE